MMKLCDDVACQACAARRWNFVSLGRLLLPSFGDGPFLAMRRRMFASPAPLSLGEETLISPDTVSDLFPEQGPPLAS